MQYPELNQSFVAGGAGYTEAWNRVLSRLGDYVASIVQALNMRPLDVALLAQTPRHLLVRISSAEAYMVLRIAPEHHLLCELFFGRTMAARALPAAQVIYADLKRTLVPFDYMLESYVCGIPATAIDPAAPHLLRQVARHAGRALRQMHRVPVPGWGHPTRAGRWLISEWRALLAHRHETLAPLSVAALLFTEQEQAAATAVLSHPALQHIAPCLLHGAPGPHTVRCTIGEHVQLEALVDPGTIVAGDGMLDLAWALNPAYSATWRDGLLEGYNAVAPLSADERERLRLLRLLTCYWSACHAYALAEPHEAAYALAQELLAEQPAPPLPDPASIE